MVANVLCGCRVDLRTCDWHPEQRHCVAKGNRKCRPWDSSNAREILKHAHAYKSKGLFGFELGNELAAGGGTVSGDRTPGAHPDRCRARLTFLFEQRLCRHG